MRKMRVVLWLLLTVGVLTALEISGTGAVRADDTPVLVDGGGKTLKDLTGAATFVTIVLKTREAPDQNLRIREIGPDYLSVITTSNERTAYKFADIKEVRVQNGLVEAKKFTIEESRSLKSEQLKWVQRAFDRAREIYDASSNNQSQKMRAAMLLAVNRKNDAHDYLRQLAASNDLQTQLDAVMDLYIVGDTDIGAAVVDQGLDSGNPKIRGKAAELAGLLGLQETIPTLLKMVGDRSAPISAPAAKALARLKNREAIPTMLRMLVERTEEKGRAAVFALARLDGPEVIEQVKNKLTTTSGDAHFRVVLLLYKLGDPAAKKLMIATLEETPSLAPEAALVLARDNQYDGKQYLLNRLRRQASESEENLIFRAKAAAALVQGEDPTAVSSLQELLRTEKASIKKLSCQLIAELGARKLLATTQPVIENADAEVALEACCAAVAVAKSDFRQRLSESRN